MIKFRKKIFKDIIIKNYSKNLYLVLNYFIKKWRCPLKMIKNQDKKPLSSGDRKQREFISKPLKIIILIKYNLKKILN